jgi:hypothetical protein
MISCKSEDWKAVFDHFESEMFWCERLGMTCSNQISVSTGDRVILQIPIAELRPAYSNTLEFQLAAEVLA